MSQDTLNLINALAAIFSAIGTVAAVIVALYLARRDEMQRLKVNVDAGGTLSRKVNRYGTVITITNIGRRSVRINSLEWRYKAEKELVRLWFNSLEQDPGNSPIPIKLEDGDVACYFFQTDDIRAYLDKLDKGTRKSALQSLRIVVNVSGGNEVAVKPGRLLRGQLEESLQSDFRSRVSLEAS